MILLGAALLSIPVIGVIAWLACWYMGSRYYWRAFGPPSQSIDGMLVVGNCPHCQTEVYMLHREENAKNCPGCKHRLIYRKDRYLDVTA